jgi:hypothetical protein
MFHSNLPPHEIMTSINYAQPHIVLRYEFDRFLNMFNLRCFIYVIGISFVGMSFSLPFNSEFHTSTEGQSSSVGSFLQCSGALPFEFEDAAVKADPLPASRRVQRAGNRMLSFVHNDLERELRIPNPMSNGGRHVFLTGVQMYIINL